MVDVARLADAIPKIRASIATADVDGALAFYRRHMEEHVMCEMAPLAASTVPDHDMSARRAELVSRHAATAQNNTGSKQLPSTAPTALSARHEVVGEELRRKWLLGFALRTLDLDAVVVYSPTPLGPAYPSLDLGNGVASATSPIAHATPHQETMASIMASGRQHLIVASTSWTTSRGVRRTAGPSRQRFMPRAPWSSLRPSCPPTPTTPARRRHSSR